MTDPIRVIQYGLGPIGQACVRYIVGEYGDRITVVGAVDIDPEKIGQDIGQVCGLDRELGIGVSPSLNEALSISGGADAVVHTTASSLALVSDQLIECMEAGVNVVSSTEELSYPWDTQPDISRRLDQAARNRAVSIVGTGVNPGFIMDSLPLLATSASARVESIKIQRKVDAGIRRLPLQRKIGAGLTLQEFAARKATGKFGHVGLKESALMVAAGLGWSVESVEETLDPVTDDRLSPGESNEEGYVLGIHQHVAIRSADGRSIELDLKMYVGADNPGDSIKIEGEPPLELVVPGGVFGDTATVAMLVNTLPRICEATPGLKTMLDLPLPRAFAGIKQSRGHYTHPA